MWNVLNLIQIFQQSVQIKTNFINFLMYNEYSWFAYHDRYRITYEKTDIEKK